MLREIYVTIKKLIRSPLPTLFLAVFKYIQQFLSRKDIIDFLKLGFNTSPQHVTDIFIYRAQNFFNTSFTEDKKVSPLACNSECMNW